MMIRALRVVKLLVVATLTTGLAIHAAQVDLGQIRAHMLMDWTSPMFKRQELNESQKHFFTQVLTGLDRNDTDFLSAQSENCVRREIRRLSRSELEALSRALNRMKGEGVFDIFVAQHRFENAPCAHFSPSFILWHRLYLLLFQRALQRYNSDICVPYMDTRLDCHLSRPSDSALWTEDCLGENWGTVRSGIQGNWRVFPRDCNLFGNGLIHRYMDRSSCGWDGGFFYTSGKVARAVNSRNFDRFVSPYSGSNMEMDHGGVHMGVNGHVASLTCATNDLVFWLHHCFVDKLYEDFCLTHTPADLRYPSDAWLAPCQRSYDQMEPFNFRNADPLNDQLIGKQYMYEISPADLECADDAQCGGERLWCNGGTCMSKVREGGTCFSGVDDPARCCYCPGGQTASCTFSNWEERCTCTAATDY